MVLNRRPALAPVSRNPGLLPYGLSRKNVIFRLSATPWDGVKTRPETRIVLTEKARLKGEVNRVWRIQFFGRNRHFLQKKYQKTAVCKVSLRPATYLLGDSADLTIGRVRIRSRNLTQRPLPTVPIPERLASVKFVSAKNRNNELKKFIHE